MAKTGEDFIEVTDSDSIERALINAEIEYSAVPGRHSLTITTENGISFKFDRDGQLVGLKASKEREASVEESFDSYMDEDEE